MSEKENTNCLEGMKCPECGSLEPFRIEIKTMLLMYDDGSEDDKLSGSQEWDDDSYCECCGCLRHGTVQDFKTEKKT
jgi:hypothetical protein